MRGIIIIVFIFIFILIIILNDNQKYECYNNQYKTINSKSLKNISTPTIHLDINQVKKDIIIMDKMIQCIECKKNRTICDIDHIELFGVLDEEISLYEMIKILYESYIDNFLDIYVTKRFNFKHYLTIKYQYPENKTDQIMQLFFILKNKISFIKNNIDDKKFNYNLFMMTTFDLNDNLQILEELYDNITNRNTFTLEDIKDIIINLNKKYLSSVLKFREDKILNIGFKFINTEDNEYISIEDLHDPNKPIVYSYKKIKEENIVDIIESIERMIENEINEIETIIYEKQA